MAFWTLFLSVLMCSFYSIQSLKDVKAIVPLAAKARDTVMLRCEYDSENDPVYTVKWYKGRSEFFRYMPKEDPSMRIFPVQGIRVDLSRSSPNEVALIDVEWDTTGKFLCEVSTDAPVFDTKISSGFMYVINVPDEAPIMEILKKSTGSANTIQATCTTPPTFPAMNITWYINGIKVEETGRKSASFDPTYAYSKNRRVPHMTVSHLDKEIDDNTFQGGTIKIQCIGTLFHLYKSENVRFIEENRPQPWPSSVIGISGVTRQCLLPSWVCFAAMAIILVFVNLK
ncbi:hypothetical protein ABEB36_008157 [Hypothenemus hampei]|uniref:Ig-like domain-containing protein n=1 Tax=Hypothenemus hampei TaxID=57062 RepID=A0ABD1ELD0_HYPHA